MIVAGHRRPDGDDHAVDSMIAETRAYLKDFAAAYEVADDAEELVRTMSAKYPGHGNLWTLQFLGDECRPAARHGFGRGRRPPRPPTS